MQRSSAYRWERLPKLLLSRCDAFLRGPMPRSGKRRAFADTTYSTTRRGTREILGGSRTLILS